MYGDVNSSYAELLRQASSYAQSQLQEQSQAQSSANFNKNLQNWLFWGGIGLGSLALIAVVIAAVRK